MQIYSIKLGEAVVYEKLPVSLIQFLLLELHITIRNKFYLCERTLN